MASEHQVFKSARIAAIGNEIAPWAEGEGDAATAGRGGAAGAAGAHLLMVTVTPVLILALLAAIRGKHTAPTLSQPHPVSGGLSRAVGAAFSAALVTAAAGGVFIGLFLIMLLQAPYSKSAALVTAAVAGVFVGLFLIMLLQAPHSNCKNNCSGDYDSCRTSTLHVFEL